MYVDWHMNNNQKMHMLFMSLSHVFATLFNHVTNKYRIVQHFESELLNLSQVVFNVLLSPVFPFKAGLYTCIESMAMVFVLAQTLNMSSRRRFHM